MAITISAVILDLCLRKTRADKSPDYGDVIVFEKLCFQNVFRPHYAISAAILNLCLRQTRADKSHDYADVIVFEKIRFQIAFPPH